MRIVIVGDGKIGSALAEQLSREGHEITIVDRSGAPLQRTVEDLDILSIEGNGATYATQLEAGVDEAELVIAVTAQDELNLLCCLVAKKIGAKHTIARVRNPEYAGELSLISDDLGLSLSVNPELICATEMARTLRTPSAIKTDTFFGGKVELLKFQLPADSPLAGRTLMELPGITRAKVLICAVERGEQEIHIPSGSFRLQAGDRISFVASYAGAQQFFRQMKLAAGQNHFIRLERLHVNKPKRDDEILIDGVVENIEYYGLYIKYYIDVGSQILKAIEKNDGINIYAPGEKVTVAMKPTDVMSYDAQ